MLTGRHVKIVKLSIKNCEQNIYIDTKQYQQINNKQCIKDSDVCVLKT